MRHTISALVENHFGVLARVAGLFSARGFNIDSLAVGETEDSTVSRMTIVIHGDDRIVDQIMKQLHKLIEVIKVFDLTEQDMIDRELALAKVTIDTSTRSEVMQIIGSFRGKVVDVGKDTMTIEVTGGESKVDAMLELLRPYGLKEVVRTGVIALSRKIELTIQNKKAKAPAKAVKNKKSTKKVRV